MMSISSVPAKAKAKANRTQRSTDFSLAETLRTDPYFPTAYQTIETTSSTLSSDHFPSRLRNPMIEQGGTIAPWKSTAATPRGVLRIRIRVGYLGMYLPHASHSQQRRKTAMASPPLRYGQPPTHLVGLPPEFFPKRLILPKVTYYLL